MSSMTLCSGALALACALCGLAAFSGCPQPIDPEPTCADGGAHPGGGVGNGGGGNNNNGNPDGGTSGVDGGMNVADAGLVSRADAGPFSWAIIPGSGVSETVEAIHGNSATNIYTASSKGIIRRSNGGTFADVYATAVTTSPPSLFGITVTPNGNVFAGGQVLVACTNNTCAEPAHFAMTAMGDLTPMYGTVFGVCSRGNDTVYAVGSNNGKGRIWQYDFTASQWVVRVPDTGAATANGCYFADNGDLFIAANLGQIVRMTPSHVAFVEPVNPAMNFDGSNFSAQDLVSVGGRFFAVGEERAVIERDHASKTWNVVLNPPTTFSNSYAVVGGGASDELYAAGTPSSDNVMTRWDGARWSLIRNTDPRYLPYYMTVEDMWMPDPDTLFLVGSKSSDGVVVLGER